MSKKLKADVCVIVPNYNNGRYLDEFLQSVLNSTVEPSMLLIVDDGSTDNSAEVLAKYSSLSYLKVIYLKTNQGLTSALNTALDHAQAKYIMRADPDDILHPRKIELQYDFLELHPEIDILGCNVLYFNNLQKKINSSNFPLLHKHIVNAYRKGEHGVQHPTMMIKSEVYQSYRYQPLFPGEDYEILARMANDGRRFANQKEKLYYMRVHSGSSTSNLRYSGIENTFMFRDRIFGTTTSKLRKKIYYYHISCYRRYQISPNLFKRWLSMLCAVFLHPSKLFKRIFSY